MNNLNITVRRSTSANVPPTPTIIVTEPMTHSLASETAVERTRKDLEHNRKDAERELYRSEDTGLLEAAERTTDIVHFWEVCQIFPLTSYD
jgi:hypothetical protein